jgi:hypothetical protein
MFQKTLQGVYKNCKFLFKIYTYSNNKSGDDEDVLSIGRQVIFYPIMTKPNFDQDQFDDMYDCVRTFMQSIYKCDVGMMSILQYTTYPGEYKPKSCGDIIINHFFPFLHPEMDGYKQIELRHDVVDKHIDDFQVRGAFAKIFSHYTLQTLGYKVPVQEAHSGKILIHSEKSKLLFGITIQSIENSMLRILITKGKFDGSEV